MTEGNSAEHDSKQVTASACKELGLLGERIGIRQESGQNVT